MYCACVSHCTGSGMKSFGDANSILICYLGRRSLLKTYQVLNTPCSKDNDKPVCLFPRALYRCIEYLAHSSYSLSLACNSTFSKLVAPCYSLCLLLSMYIILTPINFRYLPSVDRSFCYPLSSIFTMYFIVTR